jgi:Helix-turn-helix domain
MEERTLMATYFNASRESRLEAASLEPGSVRAYRIAEVCKLTGLGRTSVYAAIKSGDLVARKWKRCTIVLGDDLASFLNNLTKIG